MKLSIDAFDTKDTLLPESGPVRGRRGLGASCIQREPLPTVSGRVIEDIADALL